MVWDVNGGWCGGPPSHAARPTASYPSQCTLALWMAGVHLAGLLALVAVLFSSSCLALGNIGWGSKGRRAKARERRGWDWLAVAHHALALSVAGLGVGVAVAAAVTPDPVGLARPVAGLCMAVTWALLSLLAALYPPLSRQAPPSAVSFVRSSSVLLGGLDYVRRLLAPAAAVLSLLLLVLEAHAGDAGPTVVAAVGTVGLLVQTAVAWALGIRASPQRRRWRWWPRRAGAEGVDTTSSMPLISVLEDGDAAVAGVDGEEEEDDDEEQLESHSSVMSRLTFWWITPLLSKGYRAKTLGPEDLPHLERSDQPPVAHAAFRREWARTVARAAPAARAKGRGGHMVLGALIRANWVTFVACGLVLVASTVLQLTIPVVLNRLLDHIDAGAGAPGGVALGYTLAVGLFVLVVLQSMTEHQFWIWGIRCGMRCQSALMAECFRKALYMGPESRQRYPTGNLINLMSVDACRVADVNVVPMVHWGTWCALLVLVVALVALHALLGWSSLLGVAVIGLFWPLGYLLGVKGKAAAARIQQERDRRASLMSEALASIRLVKSLQWEGFAAGVIQAARRQEVRAQVKRSACFGGNGALAQLAQVMGPLAAFACRILVEKQPLTAAVAFTSLAWFNLLKRPLNSFPSALTALLDCLVSWERLESLFLASEVASAPELEADATGGGGGGGPLLVLPDAAEAGGEGGEWAIEVEGCTFAWSAAADATPALQDVTLRVRPGELLVVVGPVGAGKSTLLHSLVGDTVQARPGGRWHVRGRVALVEQSPWVQNTTVRENVVFGAAGGYDRGRFREVVRRCGLQRDLQGMAARGGENMEVGEGGIALSGGQRQRVSLARAVYSDPDVCLLDDVLSSLDVTVGRRIWEECLVEYLRGKTRVVVTHQTHFLEHPAVDRIVVLDDKGRVCAVGAYAELLAGGNPFVTGVVLGHNGHNGGRRGAAVAGGVAGAGPEADGDGGVHIPHSEGDGGESEVGDGAQGEGEEEDEGEEDAWMPDEGVGLAQAFNDNEERKQGGIEARLLVTYLRRFGGCDGLGFAAFTLGLFVLEQACNVLQWFWLSRLTGSDSGEENARLQASEVTALMGLGAALCVITTVRILVLIYGAVSAGNVLHGSMLRAILRAPMRFFDRQPSGRVLNRFIADQAAIDGIVPSTLADFFQQLLYFGATLCILCYALPEMLPVVVLLAFPYRAISTYYRWPARDLRRLEAVSKSPVNTHYAEAVRGASVIRAFGAQPRFMAAHLALSTRSIQCYWIKWVANQWVTIWLEMVGTLFMLGCGVLSVWVTSPQAPAVFASHIDGGKMGLLMSYAVLVPNNLGWLLKVYFMAEIEFISVERIAQYCGLAPEAPTQQLQHEAEEEEEEQQQQQQKPALAAPGALPQGLPVQGRGVALRYGGPEAALTLKGLDLAVGAGEKVAIVGRTAAGKSSVFQALLGFYPVEPESSLTVDGREVSALPLADLRRRVRLVPQTPTLFGTTVADALVGAAEAAAEAQDDARVWKALERVRMLAAVRALPQGLATPLDKVEFSAGERQLLCIARALLNAAPVMLCDEVTSAIDLETDATIHEVLLALPSTVLFICHRLHHIREFDRVVVMEQGRAIEAGAPAALLKDPASALSGMVKTAELGKMKKTNKKEREGKAK